MLDNMNQLSQSPNLLSPSSGSSYNHAADSSSSIVSSTTTTNTLQDTSIPSHNDQQMISSTVDHHNSSTAKHDSSQAKHSVNKKNLKTEYKSNFTPFDQYVYNEVTDSFVKVQHSQAGANTNNQLSNEYHVDRSGSNQDLSGAFDAGSNVSPALEVSSFEPINGSNHKHNVNEPWYREVVKRNEKANEYRFKSEVGHSSPLFKTSDEDLRTRKSPLGNDPLTDAEIRDHQLSSEQSKHSIRFTASDYKRDHLIAYMANNNNFNLPKSQSVTTSGANAKSPSASQPRRAQSSRPATQLRARSQSSRRQVAPTSVSKADPLTKSNQTTPTKVASSRFTKPVSSRVGVSTTVASRYKTPATTTTTQKTTTTTNKQITASSNRNVIGRPTTVALAKRTPTSTPSEQRTSNIISTRVAAKPRSPTTAISTKSTTSSRVTSRGAIPLRPTTTGRTTSDNTTVSSQVKSSTIRPKSPIRKSVSGTNAAAPSRPVTGRSSANISRQIRQSTRANATPRGSNASQATTQTISNEIKSIKTPRAIASANAKAAAAAAASVLVTSSVIAHNATSSTDNLVSEFQDSNQAVLTDVSQSRQEVMNIQDIYASQEEQNLIFSTTEAGNMLADEIAQAEKAASEEPTLEHNQRQDQSLQDETGDIIMHQATTSMISSENPPEITTGLQSDESKVVSDFVEKHTTSSDSSEAEDLVNGLADGLVSAEDRFDSSEREGSMDNFALKEFENQHKSQRIYSSGEQNMDEEPYSIIPTTYANVDQVQHDDLDHKPESFDPLMEENDSAGQQYFIPENDLNIKQPDDSNEYDRFKTMTYNQIEYKDESDHTIVDLGLKGQFNDSSAQEKEVQKDRLVSDIKEKCENLEALNDFRNKFNEDEEEATISCDHDALVAVISAKEDIVVSDEVNQDEKTIIDNQLTSEISKQSSDLPTTGIMRDRPSEPGSSLKSLDFSSDLNENVQESTQTEKLQISTDAMPTAEIVDKLELGSSAGVKHDVINGGSDYLDGEQATTISAKELMETANIETAVKTLPSFAAVLEAQLEESIDLSTSDNVEQSNDSSDDPHGLLEANEGNSELLMNVADLMNVEATKKQEMASKSEIAKQQSSPLSSNQEFHHDSEILLSADQLNEQFIHLSTATGATYGDNLADSKTALGEEHEGQQGRVEHDHGDDKASRTALSDDDCVPEKGKDSELAAVRNLSLGEDESNKIHSNIGQHFQEAQLQENRAIISVIETDLEEQKKFDSLLSSSVDTKEGTNDNNEKPVIEHTIDLIEGEAKENSSLYDSKPKLNNPGQTSNSSTSVGEKSPNTSVNGDSNNGNMNLATSRMEAVEFDGAMNSAEPYDAFTDDLDNDEHLKLSNHLTNSDDELILDPRASAAAVAVAAASSSSADPEFSPQRSVPSSRYNEGAGLGLMAHDERFEADSAELADGSSAELVTPTVAENRIEVSVAKHTMHELPQATFIHQPKLTHEGESDDDDDFILNPDANPIDVAATMSPSSSVAEEMLRLSRRDSNPLLIMQDIATLKSDPQEQPNAAPSEINPSIPLPGSSDSPKKISFGDNAQIFIYSGTRLSTESVSDVSYDSPVVVTSTSSVKTLGEKNESNNNDSAKETPKSKDDAEAQIELV